MKTVNLLCFPTIQQATEQALGTTTAVKGMRRHEYQQTELKDVPLFFPCGCREGRKEAFPPTTKFPFPERAVERTAKT